MKCRAVEDCDRTATEALVVDAGDVLEFTPLCHDHAPVEIFEMQATSNRDEWAALAIRSVAGGLS